jgi:hypothetical protein
MDKDVSSNYLTAQKQTNKQKTVERNPKKKEEITYHTNTRKIK